MKICVIGCTGYIGSKISNEIGRSRHQLFGLCRKKPKKEIFFLRNFSRIIEGNIKSHSVQKKIADYKFDVIIYTVSLNHIDSENNLKKSLEVNYYPLANLCSLIRERKNKTKFLYFSTMQVYGNYVNKDLITEKENKEIRNNYALTHSLCEDTLSIMNQYSFFDSICIRLSNGYGFPQLKSCDCWWLVINDFCINAIKKHKIIINSDGSPLRDFIHVNDIARGIYQLCITNKKIPPFINFAAGNTLSMLELASIVYNIGLKLDKNLKIEFQNRTLENKELKKRLRKLKNQKKFNISNKIMKDFKIKPKISLKNGIKKTLQDIKKNEI